ncbi:MAG: tRNA uridine-5-carboxymethylaminomethyl(34) synthesis GTPase MnmE [Bacteroidaceae bacterium]|nr:tRNA uridine-5-carboxymethylaminomethyl(34) synthesis GTPase MnmE [Bacteroidaceae bacterium]
MIANKEDTICAIATAQGGAIGLIRVSGTDAISFTSAIFRPIKEGKKLEDCKPYSLTYGHIMEGNDTIDEVMVSLFKAPHSYTGEDSTEIACHGSSYILQRVIQLLIKQGCRLAQPGEYTQRAFLNGKMDLSQAEAVADLIASTSAATHRLAMNQMRGGFSKRLADLRNDLLKFSSLIELELDFSDHEDLEFADRTQLRELANHIEQVISQLVDSFEVGNAFKHGVPVAIIGETNAGKSTLLNALLGEERAIVSEISGTTRDVIEDTINICGITFRFIDTAGIRQTSDAIENMGIERTFQKIDQASIVLWLLDVSQSGNKFHELQNQILPHCEGKKLILVFNKEDLATTYPTPTFNCQSIAISAKHGTHLDDLRQLLVDCAQLPEISQGDVIVTNARHHEALTHALDAIHRVQRGMEIEISADFLAQDIRECIHYLSDIVGEVTTDDTLQFIFSHFCVGK